MVTECPYFVTLSYLFSMNKLENFFLLQSIVRLHCGWLLVRKGRFEFLNGIFLVCKWLWAV
jgi:hypothetical protein